MTCKKLIGLSVALAIAALAYSAGGCSRVYQIAVSGIVRDAVSGEPLKDVGITIAPADDRLGTPITDQKGEFLISLKAFENDFVGKSPKWTLTFSKNGFAPATCEVDLSVGQPDPKAVDSVIVVVSMRRAGS